MGAPIDETDKLLVATSSLELQRVSQELGETRTKLLEERRRREENLDKRLDALDRGQTEIIRRMDEVKEKALTEVSRKVDLRLFEALEDRVDGQARYIWIGVGICLAAATVIPITIHLIFRY